MTSSTAKPDTVLSPQQVVYGEIQLIIASLFRIVGHTEEESSDNAEIMMVSISQAALLKLFEMKDEITKQDLLKKASTLSEQDRARFVTDSFTPLEISQAMQAATTDHIGAYFAAIKDDLSPEQVTQIELLVSALQEKKAL